jgi:DeoR/GlpR family transcriptional regulator of sugar metabolism
MLPAQRQKKIIELLQVKDFVKIQEFIDTFNVSIETVRRDLATLEEQKKIKKVYGGAKLIQQTYGESSFSKRLSDKKDEKKSIGRMCADMIDDGDSVFIDSGSTTLQIAKHIKDKKNIFVVTNSLPVVMELINTSFEIVIIGGKIRKEENSVVNYNYLFNFDGINIQKSFLGASGITVENGISDYSMTEAMTRKEIIKRSNKIFIAADSSKYMRDVPINIANINAIDYLVTDGHLKESIIKKFENVSPELIIAPLNTNG